MTENLQKPVLTKLVLWLMTISSGLIVANIYYNQPLLSLMAKDFGVSESNISNIAMLTQIGYACGLLFIIPLGDMFKRKRMILIDFIFIILSLLGMYYAPSANWLFPCSFLIGFTSVIPQIFVPMAAELSTPERKTQTVGMVMSGLLIGILLSRVFSGYVGALLGWRAVFLIGAGIMLLLWTLIAKLLPDVHPNYKGSYGGLMQSIITLIKEQPSLRVAALRGGLCFGSFCGFWTTLVFHLEGAPFYASSDIAGAFGLIGAVGAFAAATVGRLTKKYTVNQIIIASLLLMMLGWGCFAFVGNYYIGLIIGVIIIDLAIQSVHVCNQSIIFNLKTTASNRVNTVYMTTYFIGGSLGTFLSAQAWHFAQWNGVVIVGSSMLVAAILLHIWSLRSSKPA